MRAHVFIALLLTAACEKQEETVRPDEVDELTEEDKELSDDEPEDGAAEGGKAPAEPIDTATKIDGGLTEAQVEKTINANHQRVRECFDQALADLDSVNLDGAVVIEWNVASDGKVEGAKIAATNFGHGESAECIASAVEAWTFPKPKKGGATVRYAFQPRLY